MHGQDPEPPMEALGNRIAPTSQTSWPFPRPARKDAARRSHHRQRLVEARTARLKELPHAALSFVIEEVAARKVLGSPEVQREQMGTILQLIDERGIRVAIVPEYAPRRPVSSGAFRIMTLHDGRLVGHAEHWGGQQVISTPTQVNRMVSMFGHLQAESLSHDATVELIRELRKGTS